MRPLSRKLNLSCDLVEFYEPIQTLRLMLRFLVVWAAWGKWVSAVKMWSSLNVSLSWPMLLDMCWSPYVWQWICVRQEHKNNTKLATFGLSWLMQSILLLVLEICWICTRQDWHWQDSASLCQRLLDLALPDMCACYTETKLTSFCQSCQCCSPVSSPGYLLDKNAQKD